MLWFIYPGVCDQEKVNKTFYIYAFFCDWAFVALKFFLGKQIIFENISFVSLLTFSMSGLQSRRI